MKMTVNGASSYYNDSELAVFRNLIRAWIDEVSSSLRSIDSLAGDEEHKETLANTGKACLKELKMALTRIDNRTFGICRATGKMIARDVLRARPETTIAP